MFAPELTLPVLRHIKARFGDRAYGRYGFADAFHPGADWIDPDVIGIDLGITLLSAENLRTGHVWRLVHGQPRDPDGDAARRLHAGGQPPARAAARESRGL